MSTVEKKLEDLFQEGLSMFNMESKSSKGIAWVDNMRQKFGVICKGVDDNKFLQETSKFVENQVQSVGLNVRKFCAEFVHELLTSSDHPVKGPLTDLSLTYGEDTENYGKVKEGLEKFYPLDEDLTEPNELEIGSDTGKDLCRDSSLDGNQDHFNSGEACDKSENDASAQSQVLCEDHSEGEKNPTQPSDTVSCSNCIPEPLLLHSSTPSDELILENASQEKAPNVPVASFLSEAATWRSPTVACPVDVSYDNIEQQEQFILPQDFTVMSKNMNDDEATECNKEIEAGKFLSFKTSENGKGLTERSAKVIHAASQSADKVCVHKSDDDDYEQVAYWYEDIDSETKQSKGISPVNLIHDTHVGKFVTVDNSESDWELL